MPTSVTNHIHDVLQEVERINPQTVLELGIGFGKWGVLLRELLDARYGRVCDAAWNTEIHGVEINRRYHNSTWHVYSGVLRCNFSGRNWSRYDLVMLMDSLEHLAPEVGRPFLRHLVANNRHVIVSVPNGPMPQGEVFGNPHEAHRWTFNDLEEFKDFDFKVLHRSICTVVSIKGELK